MAPSLEEPQYPAVHQLSVEPKQPTPLKYEPGRTAVEDHEHYEHEELLPRFPDVHWNALTEVPYHDKGLQADSQYRNLLSSATDIFDYTPKIGTEVCGVHLAQLSNTQKNDLARLIATRGVVFFRNQVDFDIEAQRKLDGGLPKLTVNLDAGGFVPLRHSDVTYEIQPPAYTSLKVLTGPPRGGGGDTLWSSQYAAYDALSPSMQKYLESLTALHSAQMQADGSRALGRAIRRDPIVTEHPLVRSHPVTGWNSLFFNPGFVTKIVGVPKTESDHIISYLNEVIATTQEMHVRFQWGKNDVAFWDNRICNHSASYGFAPHRRHAVRVACHGEKPVFDPAGKSQEEELSARYGLSLVSKDGSGIANYND